MTYFSTRLLKELVKGRSLLQGQEIICVGEVYTLNTQTEYWPYVHAEAF